MIRPPNEADQSSVLKCIRRAGLVGMLCVVYMQRARHAGMVPDQTGERGRSGLIRPPNEADQSSFLKCIRRAGLVGMFCVVSMQRAGRAGMVPD